MNTPFRPSTYHLPPSKGIAVVTGATQGIGNAIDLRLAYDGFDVFINDIALEAKITELRGVQAEIIEKGRRRGVVSGDVSNEEDVKDMIEVTVKWRLCYQHPWDLPLLPIHREADDQTGSRGRIIGCSYSTGKQGAVFAFSLVVVDAQGGYIRSADDVALWATKSAIRGLTQGAALDFGKYGITVNAYAPGAVEMNNASYPYNSLVSPRSFCSR
ncbi:NAD-binding protein [Armillaria fumosa]|nr:NAD-binding protein [Armillaria fumosa]